MVGTPGIEPGTSSMSTRRSPAELCPPIQGMANYHHRHGIASVAAESSALECDRFKLYQFEA